MQPRFTVRHLRYTAVLALGLAIAPLTGAQQTSPTEPVPSGKSGSHGTATAPAEGAQNSATPTPVAPGTVPETQAPDAGSDSKQQQKDLRRQEKANHEQEKSARAQRKYLNQQDKAAKAAQKADSQ